MKWKDDNAWWYTFYDIGPEKRRNVEEVFKSLD